ncbi:Mu transposase C-terminal domain-containing protein [Paenibacillus sp. Dod16]|uniref:Mu transposase C-terminal domain-containing protein n=1 Tax=Paenibacillus sp. Dod16 TaxID=3416392 RepID=UPI003CFBBBDE
MTISSFRLNAECEVYGIMYRIVSIQPPDVWLKRVDGESVKFNYFSLITEPSFKPHQSMIIARNKNEITSNNNVRKLSEERQDEVSQRFKIIQPILLLERIREGDLQALHLFHDKYKYLIKAGERIVLLKQKDLIGRILEMEKSSRATIMRYLKGYRQMGLDGLISDKGKGYTGRKDNKVLTICDPQNPDVLLDTITVRLPDTQIALIKEVIENEYLTKLRVSKATIYRSLSQKCMSNNIPEINYITISGIIDRIDVRAKERYRNHKKAKQIYDPVARGYADREAVGRLDIVQIDHTQIDMMVIDDVTGMVINRPWLTLGICVYSRETWCMYLSSEGPSENVVRKAIKHGVFSKNTIQDFDTQTEWVAFGIPNIIYVDNGMDFKSKDIKRLVNETLESELRHRPVKLPHYGALIERLFGTVNREVIHNIFGTTKGSIVDKGELNPSEEATLTLSDLRKILMLYLTDIYPYKVHRGLPNNLSPRVRYLESLKEMGYPDVIFDSEKSYYDIDFLHTTKKPYTRDGVRWGNRLYKSEQCGNIVGTRNKKYTVKFDIDDISAIYLLHPEINEFIKLHCESPSYETVVGVNHYTYKLMEKLLREEGQLKRNQILGKDQIEKAWGKISKVVGNSYTRKKTVRQTIAKMSNVTLKLETPYTKQQELARQKNQSILSIEEELFQQAKQAEDRRREK